MFSIKKLNKLFLSCICMTLLMGSLVFFVQPPGNGQSEQDGLWRTKFMAGVRAYKAGQYEEAADKFEATIFEAEQFHNDNWRLAASKNNLGLAYTKLGRYFDAETTLKEALCLCEAKPNQDLSIADVFYNLGTLYEQQGKQPELSTVLEKARSIYETQLNSGNDEIARKLIGIGLIYSKCGKNELAETLLKEVLPILDNGQDKDKRSTATCLQALAVMSAKKSDFAIAENFYKRAIAILTNEDAENKRALYVSLVSLGRLYNKQAKYKESKQMCDRALQVYDGLPKAVGLPIVSELGMLGSFSENEKISYMLVPSLLPMLTDKKSDDLLDVFDCYIIAAKNLKEKQTETTLRSRQRQLKRESQAYLREIEREIDGNWHPPITGNNYEVVLVFSILANGQVQNLHIVKSDATTDENLAALKDVRTSGAFGRLPVVLRERIDVQYSEVYWGGAKLSRRSEEEGVMCRRTCKMKSQFLCPSMEK